MFDNQLIALLISTITAQEMAAGIAGTPIAQAFQSTQEGVSTATTAYIYKVMDHRYGYPQKSDVWMTDKIVHTESQIYETTFQISVLAPQNPASSSELTPSDILNQIAYILQSDSTIAALQAQGVGIERVMDIRNPFFVDDRDRHEASPSFDFVVTHKQIVVTQTPVLQSIEFTILQV